MVELYANAALNGVYPQFNKAMEAGGLDLDKVMSEATEQQREVLMLHLGSKMQQAAGKGVPYLTTAVNSADDLNNVIKFHDSWLPFGDTLDVGMRPQSVQVNRGGTTQDWSTNNIYEWGGRAWRWLGGPEGPRHNPAGNDPSKWELVPKKSGKT